MPTRLAPAPRTEHTEHHEKMRRPRRPRSARAIQEPRDPHYGRDGYWYTLVWTDGATLTRWFPYSGMNVGSRATQRLRTRRLIALALECHVRRATAEEIALTCYQTARSLRLCVGSHVIEVGRPPYPPIARSINSSSGATLKATLNLKESLL